ncbi:MAG: triose-phosphate isomerase, partial [Defluviitaleaceae bacterium]|nr:triose-phosphate isomerase [Defluviitaleaceae bacterium]
GEMLAAAGAKYVLVGHSERRQYFGETDIIVNQKAQRALQSGLLPIICIGETLTQREQGITIDLLRMQTKIALQGISEAEAAACVIAYEPVWAIGTGVVATAEQAEEACAAVRQVLREIYNDQTAEKIRIQYGGSVTPKNAAELFAMPNIDGGLVGGASLKPDFAEIMNS